MCGLPNGQLVLRSRLAVLPSGHHHQHGAISVAKGFYVTIKRDKRTGWLRGPFKTHAESIDAVAETAAEAKRIDPWADFDYFGTASIDADLLPCGILNGRFNRATP